MKLKLLTTSTPMGKPRGSYAGKHSEKINFLERNKKSCNKDIHRNLLFVNGEMTPWINTLTKSEDLCFNSQNPQKSDTGAGEMTRPLRVLAVLPQVPHLIPSTHKEANKSVTPVLGDPMPFYSVLYIECTGIHGGK